MAIVAQVKSVSQVFPVWNEDRTVGTILDMELHERIRLAREQAGYVGENGRSAFAAAIGVRYETVRTWEKPGGVEQLRPSNARKVIELTAVRQPWLVSGQGAMLESGRRVTVEEIIDLASSLPTSERLRVAARLLETVGAHSE